MNTQVISLDPATELSQTNYFVSPEHTKYYIPEGSAVARVNRFKGVMYIVSGGYVETNEYTEGGQKIVYHISPK